MKLSGLQSGQRAIHISLDDCRAPVLTASLGRTATELLLLTGASALSYTLPNIQSLRGKLTRHHPWCASSS